MIVKLNSRQVFDAVYAAFPGSSGAVHRHWQSGAWLVTIEFRGCTCDLSSSDVFKAIYQDLWAKMRRASTKGVHFCRSSGEWWFEVTLEDVAAPAYSHTDGPCGCSSGNTGRPPA